MISYVKSKKTKKQKKKNQAHRYTEQIGGCHRQGQATWVKVAKSHKLPVTTEVSPGDGTHSTAIAVHDAALHVGKLLRVGLESSHHTHSPCLTHGAGCQLDVRPFHNIRSQRTTPCTPNLTELCRLIIPSVLKS